MYKWVVENRPHTDAYRYDLNTMVREANGKTTDLRKPQNGIWRVMISKTLVPFYLVPLAFIFGLMLYFALLKS